MIHLRIVAPEDLAHHTLDLLCGSDAVQNVVHLHGAATKPKGDVILCDVAREDASVIISDLKELDIPRLGSIALEEIDTSISDAAVHAEKAAAGLPSDAVVWEEVESRTSENTELGASFLAFMTIATLIAAVGIMTDSVILIIGAMVVGPEFGPLAGFCVAVVERRRELARRSFMALAVGFPVAITASWLMTLALRAAGPAPDDIEKARNLTSFISHPDTFSVIVALLAGVVGILSLTNAKSGALVGVLISVTTIPSAANIGVAAAYTNGSEWRGAMAQLSVNLAAIAVAAITTLFIQRRMYVKRRKKHLADPAREAAGLPVGRSKRSKVASG
jgi:uncharacterized hydrophobic protein (TIGR00271 family)